MKKIFFFTDWTPTNENYNGPSAHLYHLLKEIPNDKYELKIISLNANKVSLLQKEKIELLLKAKIKLIKNPFWKRVITSNKINQIWWFFTNSKLPAICRYKLSKTNLIEIQKYKPDLVWIYPHYFVGVAKQLSNYKMIITGADCSSLHCSRQLRDSFSFQKSTDIHDFLKGYESQLVMEKEYAGLNSIVHMVGIEDTNYFKIISRNENTYFFPHPHYDLFDKVDTLRVTGMLKILVSGKFDVYTYSDASRLFKLLIDNKLLLNQSYEFYFVGRDWKNIAVELRLCGYRVTQCDWVENYVEYISQFDLQIFPISVGTGTKGKVLDALSTGLLAIGSEFAFENIAVKNGYSCLQYNEMDDVLNFLVDINKNRDTYKEFSLRAKKSIREFHSPKVITHSILELCDNNMYLINVLNYKLN